MIKTWFEQGEEIGMNKGARQMILHMLSGRFQTATQEVRNNAEARMKAMSFDQLEVLAGDLLDESKTLEDLGLTGPAPAVPKELGYGAY